MLNAYLWRHPVGCPHEAVGRALDARRAEIREFNVPVVRHQDVAGFDVPKHGYFTRLFRLLCL